ncbi:MAG: carboxypeptidase regulatory-like domain-containing protein, partial [Planctomycetes bacterium]|nr:carboxypeptidase regulatory-like domain-containing protein [Planctomycetota bacterium]
LSLKRSFPNNPLAIGNVIGHPDRNINPGDYPREFGGEWALIDGLPAGEFRFQITERRHAKTLSPEFTVKIGAEPIEVTATLTLGATITGTVIDDRGQPVSGAVVTTDMNGGVAANSGLFDVFRSMIPEKHTTKKATTDAQGRFKIEQLSFADYMIRVAHRDYCEGVAINITLDREGQQLD